MKRNNKIYTAIFCIVTITAIGCVEENFEQTYPSLGENEILFGARAGFENSSKDTKTVYSGKTYTTNGKTFERIDWVDGTDMIEIYCPESNNNVNAHYLVNHKMDATNSTDYATLSRIGDSGLQWSGDKDEIHNFYAMYPSSKMFTGNNSTLAQGIKMSGTTLQAIIPTAQKHDQMDSTANENRIIAQPDMRFAYMVAKSSAKRYDSNNNQQGVSLTFVPVVTALQIELTALQDTKLAELKVSAPGIAGTYTSSLADWNGGSYPDCLPGASMDNQIIISMWKGDASEGTLRPYTLAANKTLVFTVFLAPTAKIDDIKISFSSGSGFAGKELGQPITSFCKTSIKNIKLPTSKIDVVLDNWMAQLPGETQMKALSLPGTGGSFSYASTDETGLYKSQNLDFNAQWSCGIRAFEVISDRPQSVLGGNFASVPLRCNNKELPGMTVSSVVSSVLDKLESHPDETAMLIFTYQPTGSWFYGRNPGTYMDRAMTYFNTLNSDDLVLFSPDLKLEDAKGKLMIVVRPTQNNEDDSNDWNNVLSKISGKNANYILAINGCGTSKDKWGARGYQIKGNRAPDISNNLTYGESIMEYYMSGESSPIKPTSATSPVSKSDMAFNYETNTNVECWFQEWARVVLKDTFVPAGQWTDADGSKRDFDQIYWFESYDEKYYNVVETFNMAISGSYSDYVFINSLSGYLADGTSDSLQPSIRSAYGGSGGNINALATKLNHDFYQYVLGAGLEQTTGPTGVILMDYVSNTQSDGGSYYLPSVIINNNLKYSINGGSGAIITPPASSGNKTVADFISEANTSAFYNISGTVSNFNSKTFTFTLTDASGTSIFVASVQEDWQNLWDGKISNGGSITISAKYKLEGTTHQAVEAAILGFVADIGDEGM